MTYLLIKYSRWLEILRLSCCLYGTEARSLSREAERDIVKPLIILLISRKTISEVDLTHIVVHYVFNSIFHLYVLFFPVDN